MVLLQIVLGFALLLGGGEALVRGSVAAARRLGVSTLVIGIVLVGFGTSTPELVTSIDAALLGSPGIAVGNVVGSNIANILLILGVAAAIAPVACDRRAFLRNGSVFVLAALACALLAVVGSFGRGAGAVLVAGLAAYLVYAYRRGRQAPDEVEDAADAPDIPLWQALALGLGGIVLTVLGAHLLVKGAVVLAADLGVSEAVIGVSVVAIGTSLPELTASVVAAFRSQQDMAFGNVIGSNIYNILGILGITALVKPLDVPPEILGLDLWVMLGATALLAVFAWTGARISRREGWTFLVGYAAYIGFVVT